MVEQFADLRSDRPPSDLAEAAEVGVRTLHKRFKAACGFTPLEYIKLTRLDHARAMLQMADKSTKALGIALKCYFQSPGHFARDYRLAFGELPSATLERERQRDERLT
jgi:transcriptional regulator GlxA family with amidase domain